MTACQRTSNIILPTGQLLLARSKLLVALSKKLDQGVYAVLLNLVVELLPIRLNQPRAEHVQVIHAPALRRFVQTVVDFYGSGLVDRDRAYHNVGIGRRDAHRR